MFKHIEKVSRHGLTIDVCRYADGRYGFERTNEHGERIRTRMVSLEDARRAALELLESGSAGHVDTTKISREDYEQFLLWRASRGTHRKVPEIVAEFLAEKKGRQLSYWTLRDYRTTLNLFQLAFPVPLGLITRSEVIRWLDARKVGARRWNNLLAGLKALCVWARQNRVLTAELHDIETIPKKKIRSVVQTYTVEQMKTLLNAVEPEWLPVIALGAFAGIRPEEVCPDPITRKAGMVWGDIDFRRKKVIVRAEVAKTRKKRMLPLSDALLSFLDKSGPPNASIAPAGKAFHNQMRRWPKPWIKDGLRHSYASYRLAITQDLQALSLEMGNSINVIRNHYLDLKFPEDGEAWFLIRKTSAHSGTPSPANPDRKSGEGGI
jgi:integrase